MKQKNKPFKFKISNISYPSSLGDELCSIRALIGDFTIVKTRRCLFGNMYIWVVPKKFVEDVE